MSQSDNANLPAHGELAAIVQTILAEARRLGASAAEAGVSVESGLSVTARRGEVETVEHNCDRSLGVTVYFGQRKGAASSSDFSAAAVTETVGAACAIARHTAQDPCAGLADPERLAKTVPDLDLYHPWPLSPEQAIALALECEGAALAVDPRISNSEGATVSSHSGRRVYGNSHGFLGGYPSSRHSLSCAVIGEDGRGMQRDYWYTVARDSTRLEAPRNVGRRAGQRTVRRLNARRLATCETPVIYAAEVA
ncbi:MAG TPA: metalloprotease PmbA, partial [Gammaproteobacteria bacterium]|nr:metalloprotease PmbA [Gammaproteobacteria bacterium]